MFCLCVSFREFFVSFYFCGGGGWREGQYLNQIGLVDIKDFIETLSLDLNHYHRDQQPSPSDRDNKLKVNRTVAYFVLQGIRLHP